MSQQNVKLAVAQFELTNERDFAGVMDTWADDVALVVHGFLAGGGAASGKQAVGEWFGDWFRQFERDYRFEVDEARAAGDRVFVVASHQGRGRHSGATVGQRAAYVYTVKEGKVSRIELWADEDRDAALEAAGLAEQFRASRPQGRGA